MPADPSRVVAIEAILAILMLAGASWSDILTRRVRNAYWFPFIVVAAILWLERLRGPLPVDMLLGSAVLTVLVYALWYFGTFGGADAKALMLLAWLWPDTPDLLAGRTYPVLDMLVNASVLALVLPVAFLVWNLARGRLAFPAMLFGAEMPRAEAEQRFVWPMQRIVDGPDGPVLRWRFWQRPTEALDATYGRLRVAGIDPVWVTPKIPFMIPLALGAGVTWLLGNVLLWAMLRP